MVTGDAHVTITKVGSNAKEACAVIWNVLCDKGYVSPPLSEEAWTNVSAGFEQRWNFPNALAAIDEKHVIIQAKFHQILLLFILITKKRSNIVLMAVCDAKYNFTLVDIRDTGRQNDDSVYANNLLVYAIENDLFNIPQPSKLLQSEGTLPYVFTGDDAFGLKSHVMKPHPFHRVPLPKRVSNYSSSRAGRIIENVFGVATSRFLVLHRPIIII